jgi:hypothetical protein
MRETWQPRRVHLEGILSFDIRPMKVPSRMMCSAIRKVRRLIFEEIVEQNQEEKERTFPMISKRSPSMHTSGSNESSPWESVSRYMLCLPRAKELVQWKVCVLECSHLRHFVETNLLAFCGYCAVQDKLMERQRNFAFGAMNGIGRENGSTFQPTCKRSQTHTCTPLE